MNKFFTFFAILGFWGMYLSPSFAQCPDSTCLKHYTVINTAVLPEYGVATNQYQGDIDNNSDCEDNNNNNCWKFRFVQHDPIVSGVSMDIGQGVGCTGQIDVCYSEIDGFCEAHGDGSSHSFLSVDFGITGVIDLWICDNSSGNVTICVGANLLSPTPVELMSFTSAAIGQQVMLNWETEKEERNQKFIVQRSKDGDQFEDIGSVAGKGTTNFKQSYFFIDRHPLAAAYYRLKQIDFDGQYNYYPVIYQERKTSPLILNVFPSLSVDRVNISIQADDSPKAIFNVAQISGEVYFHKVFTNLSDTEYMELDVTNYPSGIYLVSLTNKNGTSTERFVVSRE